MGPFIYTRRISGCIERECNRGIGDRRNRVRNSGGIFNMFEEGIRWRRGRVSESDRVEEIEARRKNNGGVCAGVQEGGKRKQVQEKTIDRGV